MRSEDRFSTVLGALSAARAMYLSAVAATLDEVTSLLAAATAAQTGAGARAAVELGVLGTGRIDAERFAALFTSGPVLDEAATRALERTRALLADLVARQDALFHLRLERGADVAAGIEAALAFAGRAFGGARAAELARTGRFRAAEHAALFDPFPFRLWSRQERRLAPPLVVELDGADLGVAFLADYLDGAQKIVLLVSGAMPPAPLVRLISPGVVVEQSEDAAGCALLGAHDGPGVVAIVDDPHAALFAHDPAAGATLADRLTITRMPGGEPRAGPMRSSPFQRAQELGQLRALSELAASRPAPGAAQAASTAVAAGRAAAANGGTGADDAAATATAGADPADRLAAWLLHQAGLPEPRA